MSAGQIRVAATGTVPTFYVTSPGGAGEYAVKRFRKANGPAVAPTVMTCNCPDYTHRGQVLGLPCKHIHLVQMLAKAAGGWAKLKAGLVFNLTFTVQR